MNKLQIYLIIIIIVEAVLVDLRPLGDEKTVNNTLTGEPRAGLTDILNPQNLANTGNNNGIFLPNLLNRTESQSNPLKEVKLLFLTVQGALMPANIATGSFNNFLPNLFGNMQNLNPLNQK